MITINKYLIGLSSDLKKEDHPGEFIFDTLAIREHPKPFESLSGFLTRLCEMNCIRSVNAASAIFFPNQSVRVTRFIADFPPLRIAIISRVTNLNPNEILNLTFYPLTQVFIRSSHPQTISRFLSHAISSTLRFCPLCLDESPYYRLTWRFLSVKGCSKHQCQLLDRCGFCDHTIPFFRFPFRLALCPNCGMSLVSSKPTPLNASELEKAQITEEDMEFLLSPQATSNDALVRLQSVGFRLTQLRQQRNYTRRDLGAKLGLGEHVIEGIETTNITSRGASFIGYQRYVEAMSTTFKELFVLSCLDKPNLSKPRKKLDKQELMTKCSETIKCLLNKNERISSPTVAKTIGISRSTISMNRDAMHLIKTAETERVRQNHEALIRRAKTIKQDLYLTEHCSQETLAHLLGISRAQLRRSERLMAVLRDSE